MKKQKKKREEKKMDNDITKILTVVLGLAIILLVIFAIIFIIVQIKVHKKNKIQNAKLNEGSKKLKKDEKKGNISGTTSYNKQSIFDFMEFNGVEDNMIVQKNGKRYIMVIECQGINYDLMSQMEKVGVEEGFQQFLNTLRFPIQIYIQTRTINLESSIQGYKAKLKEIESKYDNDEEEFETDNEPYFSQQDNHRNILIYLNNICKGIGGSTDYYDGYYVLNEKEDLIQIMLSFNPNNGELYVYDVEIAKNIGNEIPETINAFNWGSKALTLLSTKPFKAQ